MVSLKVKMLSKKARVYLICVFGVDIVLNSLYAGLGEVGCFNLNQIGDFGLHQDTQDEYEPWRSS
jgi:hypothetical protein